MGKQLIIRKRVITEKEIDLVNELILKHGDKGRSFISSLLCQIWDWRQENGRYKEITCRELLRKGEHKIKELFKLIHDMERNSFNLLLPQRWIPQIILPNRRLDSLLLIGISLKEHEVKMEWKIMNAFGLLWELVLFKVNRLINSSNLL